MKSYFRLRNIFAVVSAFIFIIIQESNSVKNNIIIHDLRDCNNFSNIDGPWKLNISYRHYNKTQDIANAIIDLDGPVDDTISVVVEVQKKLSEKKYKKGFFVIKQKSACRALLDYLGPLWKSIAAKGGVKNPEKCPIPKARYVLKNYKPVLRIDFDLYKGTFRAIFNIQHKFKETKGCVVADVSLI